MRLSAYHEALSHLKRGLALLESEPPSSERDQRELDLRTLLGACHVATKGYGAPEIKETFARSQELCGRLGDTPQLFPVLYGLWVYHLLRSHRDDTFELGRRMMETAGDDAQRLIAETSMATTLFYNGRLAEARTQYDRAIEIYSLDLHGEIAAGYTAETGFLAFCYYPWLAWLMGECDEARERIRRLNELAESFGAPYATATAQLFDMLTRFELREEEEARDVAERFFALTAEQNYPFFHSLAAIGRGRARARFESVDAGLEEMLRGLEHHELTGAKLPKGYWMRRPIEILLEEGRFDEALPMIEEGLAMAKTNLDTFYVSALLRLEAEVLLHRDGRRGEAVERLRRAVAVAREQGARSLELRAWTALCRVLEGSEAEEARQRLRELSAELAANGECRDLDDARAVLDGV